MAPRRGDTEAARCCFKPQVYRVVELAQGIVPTPQYEVRSTSLPVDPPLVQPSAMSRALHRNWGRAVARGVAPRSAGGRAPWLKEIRGKLAEVDTNLVLFVHPRKVHRCLRSFIVNRQSSIVRAGPKLGPESRGLSHGTFPADSSPGKD
jgi:hypothetical protein